MKIFVALWLLVASVGVFGAWLFGDISLAIVAVVALVGVRVERLFGPAANAADRFLRETGSEARIER